MTNSTHLVRIGNLGHVGRFRAADGARYARGARVICRTGRGLEVGEVLANARSHGENSDGTVLRRVSVQDELLLDRIERRKNDAYQACTRLLAERGIPAVLMDVEHLFDGQSLFFYFLGEVDAETAALTDELAEAYEAKVQFRKFTETVIAGCGPDCGTEAAAGGCGSSGGCSTCGLSSSCGTRQAS